MVKLCSYNCNSLRNSIDIVRDLLNENDILFLQETLIYATDSNYVKRIDNRFNFFITSCHRKEGIDTGRPIGGLITFWRKELNSFIQPILNENNFSGFELLKDNSRYLLINIYLPCDNRSSDNFVAFKEILASLSAELDNRHACKVVIIGDMNSHPNRGQYWSELNCFTDEFNFSFADILLLPENIHTFLSAVHNTVTWIDHIMVSDMSSISNVEIGYDKTIYDHFPLSCQINFTGEFSHDTHATDETTT